jgi:integrase
MANITKTKSGKWKFAVTVNYKPHYKTFDSKAEGYLWEESLKAGKGNKSSRFTFSDLLDKYKKEVSVKKSGKRWEEIRIEKIKRDPISKIKIDDLSRKDFAEWRDRNLKTVSNLSVLREWTLLHHCLSIAVNEWELLDSNPLTGLKKPSKPPPRKRLPSDDEIKLLCYALNYDREMKTLDMISSRVGAAMVFAIETAMRAQEICNLNWSDIKGKVATVKKSKTAAGLREVPLSKEALEIINQCKGIDESLIFGIRTSQLDSIFRKAKAYTQIDDLHFHDTRALAITRLAKKLDIFDLAKAIGHNDLRMLMVYYRKTAAEIADDL